LKPLPFQTRPIIWDKNLLDALCRASGKSHQTIRTNVKELTEVLDINLPKIHVEKDRTTIELVNALPYCTYKHFYLAQETMERKNCIKKECQFLTYVKKIVSFDQGDSSA